MNKPRKTKIGTAVAHVTRDSDTTFKVKGQGHGAGHIMAAPAHLVIQGSMAVASASAKNISHKN